MLSKDEMTEIESYLGQVPDWMGEISEPTAAHSWGLFRDLNLEETELPNREKALIGLGAAAAMSCPYCVNFHTAEAELDGVSESEISEAINVAANTRYFSTILHGSEYDLEQFERETDEIVEFVEGKKAGAVGGD